MNSPAPDKLAYDNAKYWADLVSDSVQQTGYPELGEGFNRATYRLRLNALERLLRRSAPLPLTSVLEGAVGVGAYALMWQKLGAGKWVGLDISSRAIENLARRFPDSEFHAIDLTTPSVDVALGDRTFALVTAIDVLYHIVDKDPFGRALRNLARRVSTGGHLLLSDVFCRPFEQQTALHVKRRSLSCYLSLVRPLGFELVDREAVSAILGEPVVSPSRPPGEVLLFNLWRVIGKAIRSTPQSLRNPAGWGIATCLWPLDAALRRAGVAPGRNLELAIFQKRY